MNWKSIAFDWNQVRTFLVTAEEGSLSAAARALGMAQPTVSRQVTTLEEELGVTLFERGRRATTLTKAGLELLDHVRAMGDAANRVSLAASGQSQQIDGVVRITASELLSIYVLPGILGSLREQAPMIKVEIVASNEVRSLTRREADIAIRHVQPTEPDLIAKRVREIEGGLHASSDYLDRFGRPSSIEELEKADFIGLEAAEHYVQGMVRLGLSLKPADFKVVVNSSAMMLELIKQGFGVGLMARDIAALSPNVERVLPELDCGKVPVWLITHRELHTSRRIRLVYDLLSDALANGRVDTALGASTIRLSNGKTRRALKSQ